MEVAGPLKQLQAQRDFLMDAQWVQTAPWAAKRTSSKTACLVARVSWEHNRDGLVEVIKDPLALRAIAFALCEMGFQVNCDYDGIPIGLATINDCYFSSPNDAFEALDRAIILVKEYIGDE